MRTASIGILLVFVAFAPAQEQPRTYPSCMTSTKDLMGMNKNQLLDLYLRAEPGQVPSGYTPGRVIPRPGQVGNDPISKIIKGTIWQGKHFDPDGMMTNKQFGVRTNRGYLYVEKGLLDQKPAHIIDYHDSWRVWRPFYDEFREIAPNIYLGITWRIDGSCPKFSTWFALDARKGCCESFQAK